MFARLAIGNAKRSIKDYLIYFITITLCVSLFYAFTSLSSSSYELITEDSYNFEMLEDILKYSTYVITGLLIVLIGYVNNYMIKRRQKEFATYILLGTEQRSVALMFFIETLIIGIIAIILGIVIGTLFSQVVTALVFISAKQKIVFSFRLYMDTVAITFIFFIVMFCVIGFYNIKVLRKVKLIDMLSAEKKTEFQFKRSSKVYIFMFVISIILYIISGYYTYKLINLTDSIDSMIIGRGALIVIPLVSFIIGTYTLFYSIAYIIIFIKDRYINFRYEYTNLFLIGTIISKIKTAPILMATIALTFLGAAVSFTLTLILSQWSLGYLDYRVPFDINIRNYYMESNKHNITDINDIPKVDYSEALQYLDNNGYNIDNYCSVKKYFINADDFNKRDKKNMPILAIKLSDFNKLRSMLGYDEITLKNNEFTTQWYKMTEESEIESFIKNNSKININGQELNISQNQSYTETLGEGIYNRYTSNLIILPDKVCMDLTVAATDFFANTKEDISYDKAKNFADDYVTEWFNKNNKEMISEYDEDIFDYLVETRMKVIEVNDILNLTLAMRILGIYLGTVLLMISLTVLALQQLSDSIEHKGRFKILKKLGIEDREINKIILKQILVYFVIPIVIAIIGFIIFIYNYSMLYSNEINSYIGDRVFIFNIVIALVLIIGIYIFYFIGTYYTFKRNIKDEIRVNYSK